MEPITYQPTLSRWSHVWRYGLVVLISAFGWWEIATWQWDNNRLWFWADLSLGVASLALVTQRRRYPVTVAVVTNVVSSVSGASGGPATLALISLATRRRWREIIPASLAALTAGLVLEANNPANQEAFALTGPAIVLIIGVTVGWGLYIGSRRELLATLRERAETAESEQAARVAQARTAERSRIAREMHDVLAHRISLVTMHAGALVYRQDLTAEEMRTTAGIIQDNSHEAMVELREVLGILRDGPGDAAPELPQPSAQDLADLIDEARLAGMRVDSRDVMPLDAVPETLGRTLYRVVQEGLTNTRKHAPDTLVTVGVSGSPEHGLAVSVRNPIRVGSTSGAPQSGLGLVGLAERTALAGGHLTHHVSPEDEFVLEAWLPWPA